MQVDQYPATTVPGVIVSLLGDCHQKDFFSFMEKYGAHLPQHPFGLPTREWRARSPTVTLVYHPGVSEGSAMGMRNVLTWTAPMYDQEGASKVLLRIIRVKLKDFGDGRKRHNLFFEVSNGSQIFLCGGCNDFSGTGGYYGRELIALFKGYSSVFNIALENVTLDEANATSDDEVSRLYEEHRPQQ